MNLNFSKGIRSLIKELHSHNQLDNKLVLDILSAQKISTAELEKYSTYNHASDESYGRKLIYASERFKVLLMTWLPNDFTAIHNHGQTEWGSVFFYGDATHRLYHFESDLLKISSKDQFYSGQIAPVCGDLIHIMGNQSNTPFFTLHVYGTDSVDKNVADNTEVYMPEYNMKYITAGSAYLNMDVKLTKAYVSFQAISTEALEDYTELITSFYSNQNKANVIQKLENALSSK